MRGYTMLYVGDVDGNCLSLDEAPAAWERLAQELRVSQGYMTTEKAYQTIRAFCCKIQKIANGAGKACVVELAYRTPDGYFWRMDIGNIDDASMLLFDRLITKTLSVSMYPGGTPAGAGKSCPGGFCDA